MLQFLAIQELRARHTKTTSLGLSAIQELRGSHTITTIYPVFSFEIS